MEMRLPKAAKGMSTELRMVVQLISPSRLCTELLLLGNDKMCQKVGHLKPMVHIKDERINYSCNYSQHPFRLSHG